MNTLAFLVLSAAFAGSAFGLTCYNYTAQLSEAQFLALSTADAITPNMTRVDLRLPADAPIASGCDACTRMSARVTTTIGTKTANITSVKWDCYIKAQDPDNSKCGPMFPGGSDPTALTCTDMNWMMKNGQSMTRQCACCKDNCNKRMDCGFMEDSQLYCPSRQMSLADMSIPAKCMHLRQAFGLLNDICDAAQSSAAH